MGPPGFLASAALGGDRRAGSTLGVLRGAASPSAGLGFGSAGLSSVGWAAGGRTCWATDQGEIRTVKKTQGNAALMCTSETLYLYPHQTRSLRLIEPGQAGRTPFPAVPTNFHSIQHSSLNSLGF